MRSTCCRSRRCSRSRLIGGHQSRSRGGHSSRLLGGHQSRSRGGQRDGGRICSLRRVCRDSGRSCGCDLQTRPENCKGHLHAPRRAARRVQLCRVLLAKLLQPDGALPVHPVRHELALGVTVRCKRVEHVLLVHQPLLLQVVDVQLRAVGPCAEAVMKLENLAGIGDHCLQLRGRGRLKRCRVLWKPRRQCNVVDFTNSVHRVLLQ